MSNKVPRNLKGFRDFLPKQKQARDWLLKKMMQVAKTYGFLPLETPTLEYANLLTGKYGDEADKLLYTFTDKGGRQVGLRYDQTVPTARVLAQYQNQLPKYFRRYQAQNVFRADKPQKGRYREFKQFDLDIFGSNSPIADAEVLAVTYAIFDSLGFRDVVIQVNDRELLFQIVKPFSTNKVSPNSMIQTLDKLDKKSPTEVKAELAAKGLTDQAASELLNQLNQTKPPADLNLIMKLAQTLGVPGEKLQFTPTLARGLDYYTGLIFEIVITDQQLGLGSLGGGGRYDKLINQLSKVEIPAVGVGLGFDRLVDAAKALNLLPNKSQTVVMVALYGQETIDQTLNLAKKLRQAGIITEVYPQLDKLSKQFKYADQNRIDFVALIGPDELQQNIITLKEMATGNQKQLELDQLITLLDRSTSTMVN